MTVAELIAILEKLDPSARVVAPFSPNPADINVEEVGGAAPREKKPFAGGIELTRAYSVRPARLEGWAIGNSEPASTDLDIEYADSDAPV
jgi:hypothetical protein